MTIIAMVAGCGSDPAEASLTWQLDHPVAPLVIDNDTVLIAERLAGRVLRLDLDRPGSEPRVIATVDVDGSGEQRGLLGLARIGDRVYGAWVRPGDLRLVVGDVERPTALVWVGPITDVKAIGGHLLAVDGRLIIGLGELMKDKDLLGRVVSLDPAGPSDQLPVVISDGWNNPFALTRADDGHIAVADNAPAGEAERLDGLPFPEASQRAVSAIVALPDGRFGVCGYLDGEMRGYRIEDGAVERSGTLVAAGCRTGAALLPNGRLVVSDDTTLQVVTAGAGG